MRGNLGEGSHFQHRTLLLHPHAINSPYSWTQVILVCGSISTSVWKSHLDWGHGWELPVSLLMFRRDQTSSSGIPLGQKSHGVWPPSAAALSCSMNHITTIKLPTQDNGAVSCERHNDLTALKVTQGELGFSYFRYFQRNICRGFWKLLSHISAWSSSLTFNCICLLWTILIKNVSFSVNMNHYMSRDSVHHMTRNRGAFIAALQHVPFLNNLEIPSHKKNYIYRVLFLTFHNLYFFFAFITFSLVYFCLRLIISHVLFCFYTSFLLSPHYLFPSLLWSYCWVSCSPPSISLHLSAKVFLWFFFFFILVMRSFSRLTFISLFLLIISSPAWLPFIIIPLSPPPLFSARQILFKKRSRSLMVKTLANRYLHTWQDAGGRRDAGWARQGWTWREGASEGRWGGEEITSWQQGGPYFHKLRRMDGRRMSVCVCVCFFNPLFPPSLFHSITFYHFSFPFVSPSSSLAPFFLSFCGLATSDFQAKCCFWNYSWSGLISFSEVFSPNALSWTINKLYLSIPSLSVCTFWFFEISEF